MNGLRLRSLAGGFLVFIFLNSLVLTGICFGVVIPGVPDISQPPTGSIGNPVDNACAPVSAVNITEYWDTVLLHSNAIHVNAGLPPNTAADYLYYFMDTDNWGSPARNNGTIHAAMTGTYNDDIQPGFQEYVRWDAANPFTTPPPVLPVGKLGYNWVFGTDYAAGYNYHVAEINAGRPDIVSFKFWNPVLPTARVLDGTEWVDFYTWGPQITDWPSPPEHWNLGYLGEGIGHAVTGVGYRTNYDPDGAGPLPQTNWIICHDNWQGTPVNVAVQWTNWVATVRANPGLNIPPVIIVAPDSIYHSQLVNTVQGYPNDFSISNTGNGPLVYNASNTLSWITFAGFTGSIPAGGTDQISVTVNTNGILPGLYVDSVTIYCNDPLKPIVKRPKIVILVQQQLQLRYWKPDTTYALTGMPDFPSQLPCHSGPTAVANCLWWYGAMDYYQWEGPWQLKNELKEYFHTDTIFDPWGGTDVHMMEAGLDAYFTDVDPDWPFYETTFQMPDFRVMAESLLKCQDVILLIGNWWQDVEGAWWRDGGRYVTMAGVDTLTMLIGISDPETDNAEAGNPGRVRPPHPVHSPLANTHWFPMTPGSFDYPVSHDIYPVMTGSMSPGGTWWLPMFPRGFSPTYANCPTEFQQMTALNPNPTQYPYHAEVEYAVMICPKVVDCDYYKAPYRDYAQNGMPDFDQKQDNWKTPVTLNWSWCGPVALANCIWWFDSKFEPNPVDPRPFFPGPGSPPPNDNYPLLHPFGAWDDHDMNNVVPFIQLLAPMCLVDGPTPGTLLPNLRNGFNTWLTSVGMAGAYTSQIVYGPTYPVLRDSILHSQDVILLLGFYEILQTGDCQRLGGHYVTCAGVCRQEPAVCISDPYFDKNEGEPPPGTAHGSAVHNDAFLVSGPHGTIRHDRYDMVPTTQPCPSPATWMLTNYPNRWTLDGINVFANQNGLVQGPPPVQYQGGQIIVLVDAALIICPATLVPDINVVPDSVYHSQQTGTTLTYTSDFTIYNNGTAPLTYTATNTKPWITLGGMASPIPAGGNNPINITVNTSGVAAGIYVDSVTITSNDPDTPVLNKPEIVIRVTAPDIRVMPDSLYHSQVTGTTLTYTSDFTIYNNGTALLTYALANTIPWITFGGVTPSIPPGGNNPIDVFVNTSGILPGTYVDVVTITSNDPDMPVLNKPKIVIQVTPAGMEVCDYYKPGYLDYAPNGMPDFDQKQDGWMNPLSQTWSWCGPVALANCIWWFDSKFEPNPVDPRPFWPMGPPPNDNYGLLHPFGPWDDHDMNNVIPFIQQLGPMCGVDGPSPGTLLPNLQTGFNNWLASVGMPGAYTANVVLNPGYPMIFDQVMVSQDVILLLGFYEFLQSGMCQRLGGHYVTVAGVCTQEMAICISDPYFDKNEGEPPPGSAHPSPVHNDAFFVSGPHATIHHDRYQMVPGSPCPNVPSAWMLTNYPNNWTADGIFIFANQNPVMPGPPANYMGGPIVVLVDAALIICPAEEPVPDINVFPDSLYHLQQVETNVNYNDDFTIYNNGTAPLNYSLSNTKPWITITGWTGTIAPGGNEPIDISVNTTSIPVGTYVDSVTITSNDPDTPVLNKPKIVIEVTPVGCAYIPGDVNGSGQFDGIDVGMAVNFFRGATLPPGAVRCPPCTTLGLNMLYPEGDVNGTCEFNGIDIGYMVNHFKYWYPGPPEGPYPTLYCPRCPPLPIPAVMPPEVKAIRPSE